MFNQYWISLFFLQLSGCSAGGLLELSLSPSLFLASLDEYVSWGFLLPTILLIELFTLCVLLSLPAQHELASSYAGGTEDY